MSAGSYIAKAKNKLPNLRNVSSVAYDIIKSIISAIEALDVGDEALDGWIDLTLGAIATDFSASAGNWTITTLNGYSFKVIDKNTLLVDLNVGASVTSAAPAYLKLNLMKYTVKTRFNALVRTSIGGVQAVGYIQGQTGNTFIEIYRDINLTAWAAAADVGVFGQFYVPIEKTQ